jgi:hypothetical protein
MMSNRMNHAAILALLGMVLLGLSPAAEARMGRGYGGGVGFTRLGPASGGSFAARPMAPPVAPSGDYEMHEDAARVHRDVDEDLPQLRRDQAGAHQMMRQDAPAIQQDEDRVRRDVRQEEPGVRPVVRPATRQDVAAVAYRRHWDDWHGGATYTTTEVTVGTVVASDDFDPDSCQVTMEGSDGFTYYDCNGIWYRKAFANGDVNYVAVEGPP